MGGLMLDWLALKGSFFLVVEAVDSSAYEIGQILVLDWIIEAKLGVREAVELVGHGENEPFFDFDFKPFDLFGSFIAYFMESP
jgi:hypothetical protein